MANGYFLTQRFKSNSCPVKVNLHIVVVVRWRPCRQGRGFFHYVLCQHSAHVSFCCSWSPTLSTSLLMQSSSCDFDLSPSLFPSHFWTSSPIFHRPFFPRDRPMHFNLLLLTNFFSTFSFIPTSTLSSSLIGFLTNTSLLN